MFRHFYLTLFALFLFVAPAHAATVFSAKLTQSLQYLSHGLSVNTITSGTLPTYPAANLQQMSAMGITNVRIPVEVNMIVPGLPRDNSGVSSQSDVTQALATLDSQVQMFLNNGFSVTLCVFYTNGVAALPVAQSTPMFVQANAVLAQRYGSVSPSKIFLEVLNEPQMDVNSWNTLAPQLVAAARQYAPTNTIIVDAAVNAIPTNLPFLAPVGDTNVIYNMHVYTPAELTMEGGPQAPVDPNYLFPRPAGAKGPAGSEIAKEETTTKLSAYVMTGVNWAHQHKVPLTMNEFGTSMLGDPQSDINWLTFMRQIAEANSIPWGYWAYYHLFPPAMAAQTPAYSPVVAKALGPTPYPINFGISMTGSVAPYMLTN